ncbi:hypothetical protein GCM10010437_000810 [Actinoplanes palleronii]
MVCDGVAECPLLTACDGLPGRTGPGSAPVFAASATPPTVALVAKTTAAIFTVRSFARNDRRRRGTGPGD